MNAKELRIGNCIMCNKEEIQVCINDFCEWEDNESTYSLEPIPLTEEWLVKFGFTECKAKGEYEYMFIADGYDDYRLYVFQTIDGVGYIIQLYNHYDADNIDDCDRVALPIACLYVHQLQNLYFALTGEELQSK